MSIASLRFLALLLLLAGIAYVAVHSMPPASIAETASNRQTILVRVMELSGTGPDQQSHVLFHSKAGYTTTTDSLGRVGSQVNGTYLVDGEYHTLFVTLADEYKRLAKDGSTQVGSFSEDGKPLIIRVPGMIMVKKGDATAVHMIENPSYYGYPKGYRGDDDD